jgi:hypothetical protein
MPKRLICKGVTIRNKSNPNDTATVGTKSEPVLLGPILLLMFNLAFFQETVSREHSRRFGLVGLMWPGYGFGMFLFNFFCKALLII